MTAAAPEALGAHRHLRYKIAWLSSVLALSVTSLRHEMWRDELQAWAIARASRAPWDILANLAWERHPPVWYGILWIPARLVGETWFLHLLGLVVAIATSYVIIHRAPWPLWVRVSLVSGYFFLFELGTVVRSWSLVGLLVVLVLAENDRPHPRIPLVVLLLVGLAFTALHAVPLASGLAVSVLGPRMSNHRKRWLLVVTPVVCSAILYVTLGAPDGSDGERLRLPTDGLFIDRIKTVVNATGRAALPVPEFQTSFREQFLVDRAGVLFGFVALLAVASVTRLIWPLRWILAGWIVSMAGLAFLVGSSGIPMYARQASVIYLIGLAALWQAWRSPEWAASTHRAPISFLMLAVCAGVIGGAWAGVTEVRAPFSSGSAATDFVRQQSEGRDVVVLCPQVSHLCSTVSVRLDTTLHRSADDPGSEFFEFSSHRKTNGADESVFAQAHRLAERLGVDVAVVDPLDRKDPAPCANRWEPSRTSISREEITICMLRDLVPVEGAVDP